MSVLKTGIYATPMILAFPLFASGWTTQQQTSDSVSNPRIAEVRFEGNSVVVDAELREALLLIKSGEVFSDERFKIDVERNLLPTYLERGYLQARIGKPRIDVTKSPDGIRRQRRGRPWCTITVPIYEGRKFKYRNVTFEGEKLLGATDIDRIRQIYRIESGGVANGTTIERVKTEMKGLYWNRGYLDVEIGARIKPDTRTDEADIFIQVREGRQYRVSRITFSGNLRSRLDVKLRDSFVLVEQSVFDIRLLRLSIQRLNQLERFEEIGENAYELIKHPVTGEVDISIRLQPKS